MVPRGLSRSRRRRCDPKRDAKAPPDPAPGLAAAIDDQRLTSFDECLAAHIGAVVDHVAGAEPGAAPEARERGAPGSELDVARRLEV